MRYGKLLLAIGMLAAFLAWAPGRVAADCWPGVSTGPHFTGPWNDYCNYHEDGTVDGGQYFNCAYYWDEPKEHECQDASGEKTTCKTYEYGCYFNSFSCDSTTCAGYTPIGGGAPGAVCTGPNDCATGCCKGGYCSNDCVPPPDRCNAGENFVPYSPAQFSCQSPGACEMGSDGVTGGTAGEPLWDDPCGASGSGKYRCLLGSCVPVAPACKATPPRIVSITPENVTPTTQSSRLKWLIGRDGGSTHLIRVDEDAVEDCHPRM